VTDVDGEVLAHLARMPEAHRSLLEPLLRADAADAWLRDALFAYLHHFVRVFDRGGDRADSEAALVEQLRSVAGTDRGSDSAADLEAAEHRLAKGFEERGYRFLGGRTPPHVGPYIWGRTESRSFSVTLPRGAPQQVTVHFMHDFILRGWRYWESFGEQGAGGWYQDGDADWADGLYCVADRYPEPLASNRSFQVSLLGHEAQHVADHRAFPGLNSVELEYRAKLVELIGFDAVEDRLAFFLADAADDPEQPHPYAAHLIVRRLAERLSLEPEGPPWHAVDYASIRRHAETLLDEDTARLSRG
jgi:hypothetical protein